MKEITAINCKTATIAELKKAFMYRQPITGIDQRVSHYGPHNDELLPMFLMEETPEGRQLFTGIEKSSIGYVTPTWLRKHNLLGNDGFFRALKMGFLLFGIGGGPFDEHANRREYRSCVDLVIDHLDLYKEHYNRVVYGPLIAYVSFEDSNGDNIIKAINTANPKHELLPSETESLRLLNTGELAQNIKRGFESVTTEKEYCEVIYGAFQFYKNHVRQAKMFADGKTVYDEAEKNLIKISVAGKEMVLLEAKCDHRVFHKVAHLKWPASKKEKLGVIFLHRSNGQFMLMPNRCINPEQMREVVKIIRQMIALNCGQEKLHFQEMGKNQVIDLVPEIHFDESTGIISNGSPVDQDVQGLIGDILEVKEVIRAVQIGLDTDYFPSQFAAGCRNNKCVKGACPIYQLGQERCHEIRGNEKKSTNNLGILLDKVITQDKKTA